MESLYEREITDLFDKVKSLLDQCNAESDKNSIRLLADITSHIQRLERAIRQLDAEARTKPNAESRRALEDRVKTFKHDLKQVKSSFKAYETELNRQSLMNSGDWSAKRQGTDEQRDRLINVDDKMDRGTETLEHSRKNLYEIEEVALGITENLSAQRSKIESAHQKVRNTMGIADQANRLLGLMERNERVKRMVVYGTSAFVGAVLIYALYQILFAKH